MIKMSTNHTIYSFPKINVFSQYRLEYFTLIFIILLYFIYFTLIFIIIKVYIGKLKLRCQERDRIKSNPGCLPTDCCRSFGSSKESSWDWSSESCRSVGSFIRSLVWSSSFSLFFILSGESSLGTSNDKTKYKTNVFRRLKPGSLEKRNEDWYASFQRYI